MVSVSAIVIQPLPRDQRCVVPTQRESRHPRSDSPNPSRRVNEAFRPGEPGTFVGIGKIANTRTRAEPRLRTAALGTALVFAVSGAQLGTWVSRLPAVRDRVHASPAQLGLVLLAGGVGSLVSMPSTGWLCRRFGSRTTVAITAVPALLALFLLGLAPSLVALGAVMFAWGLGYGCWDVAMNVQGSTVEQRAGRDWMPRYHACWSVGGIAGAAAGSVAAKLNTPVALHFGIAAVVGALLLAVGLRVFVPDRAPDAHEHRQSALRALRSRRLVAIGLVTLCSVIVEGAAADWLALFLVDDRHTSAAVGAAGYAAFAVAMASGRFAGTPISQQLGRHRAVGVGGITAIVGVVVTVFGPWVPLNYLGAVLWALGVCLIFPAAISAAGETPDRPTDAIAAVATLGYGAQLVGPPLIGFLANRVGLGHALLVLVVLGALISALAPAVRARRR